VTAKFDIFRIDDAGQAVWQDAALTLDDAIARVQQLGSSSSGEYFIRSQKTSVDVSLTVNPAAKPRPQFISRSEPLSARFQSD